MSLITITTKTIGASTKRVDLVRYGDGSIEFNPKTVTTGNTSNGSANILVVASTVNLRIGDRVSGSGIPAGARVGAFVANTSIALVDAAGVALNCTITATGVTITIDTSHRGDVHYRAQRGSDSSHVLKELFDALVDTN